MLDLVVYWTFQLLNSMSSLGMVISPKSFHESLFPDPPKAYEILGFSSTAVDMLHNVLRGQGSALLATSTYLFVEGPKEKSSYLLIALVCGTAAIAHFLTMQHHRKSDIVMRAIGSISPLYVMIGVNLCLSGLAAAVYFS
jgi:hypothetical protein